MRRSIDASRVQAARADDDAEHHGRRLHVHRGHGPVVPADLSPQHGQRRVRGPRGGRKRRDGHEEETRLRIPGRILTADSAKVRDVCNVCCFFCFFWRR
jgi:hypothetical protein